MSINLIAGSLLNFTYNEIVTHIPIHFIRRGFLRLCNRKIHASVKILMHAKILNFWKITLGERVVINQYCVLDCRRYTISIANDTDIGAYTRIWTLGHNPDDDTHALRGGDVIIEDHVWIATNVTILPSVTIGRGAVVAASSVVHKSIDSMDIVAGNPAKLIRKRTNALNYKLDYTPFLT